MSNIASGLFGGNKGLAYEPTAAPVDRPVTTAQVDDANVGVVQGLDQQQKFLQALQAQNGLQNQTNVFNQMQGVANGTGPNPAQAMLNQATANNIANQSAMMASQRGASTNPALLARQASMQGANTQQNAAQQAAMLQANQQLNALNQMGGLATNQANQQANATNQYTNASLQHQNNLLGGVNNQNQAGVQMQSNLNNVSGALAGGAAGQQGNMMGNMMGGMGSAMNLFKGAGGMFGGGGGDAMSAGGNTAGIIGGGGMLMDGAGAAGDAGGIYGGAGMLGSGASDIGSMMYAQGGQVKKYADGGAIANDTTMLEQPIAAVPMQNQEIPQSNIAKQFADNQAAMTPVAPVVPIRGTGGAALKGSGSGDGGGDMMGMMGGMQNTFHNALVGDDAKARTDGEAGIQFDWGNAAEGTAKGAKYGSTFGPWGTLIGGAAGFLGGGMTYEAEGGKIEKKVPAMVSPGEKYLDPKDVEKVENGKNPMQVGKTIPGKPKVGGAKNSYANDTVPATLEEGGIILPRSVTQAKDPAKAASEFVAAILAKNKHKGK